MSSDHVYFYQGRLALGLDICKNSSFSDLFENAYEAVFMSHIFHDYRECIHESSGLMKEIAEKIYERNDVEYSLVWESNPSNPDSANYGEESATGGIKPWTPSEIIRFYVIPNQDLSESVITPVMMSIYGGTSSSFTSLPSTKLKH